MFLTFLGINGPYPEKGGACSGYLLTSDSGKTNIAIDLGSGCLGRLTNELGDITKLDALILSHLHYDHMSDCLPLQYALDFSGVTALKTFAPETPAANRKLLGGKLDVYPMQDTVIGEMKVEFTPVRHPVETYAVKVICDGSTFVYTGDSNVCDSLPLFCAKCDLLLADCGLSEEDWTNNKPHFSPSMCGKLAKDAGANSLWLTHLSPRYNPEELLNDCLPVFPNTEIAKAGLRVRV